MSQISADIGLGSCAQRAGTSLIQVQARQDDVVVSVTHAARFVVGAVRADLSARLVVWTCAFRRNLYTIGLTASRLRANHRGWAVQPAAKLLDAPAVPTQHKPVNLADDYCAICSVMRLPGLPPAAPILPLPTEGILDGSVGFAFAASPYLFFHVRAPPQA